MPTSSSNARHLTWLCSVLFCALLSGCSPPSGSDAISGPGPDGDWPQWRGPRRDGTLPAPPELSVDWNEAAPLIRWRKPLGAGFSGLAIADERLFTLFAKDDEEWLVALAAASGEEIWRRSLGPTLRDSHGDGPRSTPAVDGELVYALGSLGKLIAADTTDGTVRWQVELAPPPAWGYSASPLIDGPRLIVHGQLADHEGAVLAFDKAGGSLLWSALPGHPGYASPLVVETADRRYLVSFLGEALAGLDSKTGEVLWTHAWQTAYGVNAADPIFIPPDRLFLSSGYLVGAALLRLPTDAEGDVEELWTSREMRNHFSSSVVVGPYLYGFDNSILKCLHLADGDVEWRHRGLGKGSLIAVGEHLLMLGERGNLSLAPATPEGYAEHGRLQALRGRTWTPPSLAGHWLFLRDHHHVVAVDLRRYGLSP